MSTVLRGYERREGQFTQKDTGEVIAYDNIMLHYTSDDRDEITGLFCGSIKCKSGSFKLVGADKLDDLIGKPVLMVMDLTEKTPTVGALYLDPTGGNAS